MQAPKKKSKTSPDKVVTESFLQKTLAEVLEDKPSYEDMNDVIGKYTDYMDEKMRGYRDEIITQIQDFTGRVSTLEDENSIGTEHTRELRVKVNDYESRIKALESAKN